MKGVYESNRCQQSSLPAPRIFILGAVFAALPGSLVGQLATLGHVTRRGKGFDYFYYQWDSKTAALMVDGWQAR